MSSILDGSRPAGNASVRQGRRWTGKVVNGMAAPEWHDPTDRDAARPASAGQDVAGPGAAAALPGMDSQARTWASDNDCPMPVQDPSGRGAAAMVRCQDMLDLGRAAQETCGAFFDPIVLAQLDAALAHELALRDQQSAVEAAADLDAAVRNDRDGMALAQLRRRVASTAASAEKSQRQAQLALDVVTALDDSVGGAFDPETVRQLSGAGLVDVIDMVEKVKNSFSAVQAHAQALFVAEQRLAQARAGMPKERLGRGVAHQVALARHEAPHRGRYLCELSEVVVREMPCTMEAFAQGRISEYKAGLLAKETAFLSYEHRAAVDQEICGDLDAVELMGNRELAAAARKAACALDPQSFIKRHEKAVGDRFVSLRPAADGMTYLTALIPLKQGVRIIATLTKVADSRKAAGDERGKGQVMADALMHRLINHAPCADGAGTISDHWGVPAGSPVNTGAILQPTAAESQLCTTVDEANIALELVMTDRSLFGGDNDPAILVGHEPIPAPMARNMVLDEGPQQVWLKRLFTHPSTNQLMAMDSQARLFPEGMKQFLRAQDQRCREPYCDAPIREYDHIKAFAAGGCTSIDNGQGLCADCNQAKEAPGWSTTRSPAGVEGGGSPRATEITTPTGHRYVSVGPPLSGPAAPPGPRRKPR